MTFNADGGTVVHGQRTEKFKIEREKLNAAKSAPKPNGEQIHAHAMDTIAAARKSLKKDMEFFGEQVVFGKKMKDLVKLPPASENGS